jgi:hypothetical protein
MIIEGNTFFTKAYNKKERKHACIIIKLTLKPNIFTSGKGHVPFTNTILDLQEIIVVLH